MPKEKILTLWGYDDLADFLGISRMTLSRWQKFEPIPWSHSVDRTGKHSIYTNDAKAWYQKVKTTRRQKGMRYFFHREPV